MDFREFTSVKEEIVNSITHGLGVGLGIYFLLILIYSRSQNDFNRILGFSIFGASLIAFYLISTLFHSLTFTRAHKVFKTLDHCFIFLLISGTYTPFVLISWEGKLGWGIFFLVWSITIFGIILRSVFYNRFNNLIILFYLAFGWLGAVIIKLFSAYLSYEIIYLLILGGLFYSLGIIFYLWKKLLFNHGIWHLFVLAGSISHFLAVLNV